MIDILQPCVSFNRVNTYAWYKKRVYELPEAEGGINDLYAAFSRARKWGDKIPIGIFYQKKGLSYTDRLVGLRSGPLAKHLYDRPRIKEMILMQ
jgi:2-oxoglutarate ferredoxin oxidoreductase subunit beta